MNVTIIYKISFETLNTLNKEELQRSIDDLNSSNLHYLEIDDDIVFFNSFLQEILQEIFFEDNVNFYDWTIILSIDTEDYKRVESIMLKAMEEYTLDLAVLLTSLEKNYEPSFYNETYNFSYL